jgi:hypothetical protein
VTASTTSLTCAAVGTSSVPPSPTADRLYNPGLRGGADVVGGLVLWFGAGLADECLLENDILDGP